MKSRRVAVANLQSEVRVDSATRSLRKALSSLGALSFVSGNDLNRSFSYINVCVFFEV